MIDTALVRVMHREGGVSVADLAVEFGVDQAEIEAAIAPVVDEAWENRWRPWTEWPGKVNEKLGVPVVEYTPYWSQARRGLA